MEKALINNRDFVIFGLQPWDIAIGSNCKNIASEIALNNRVLYVNRPLDRINLLKNRKDSQTLNRIKSLKEGKDVLREAEPKLWVLNPRVVVESINFLPPGYLYRKLNRRNNRRLANEISRAAHSLNFRDPILLIDDDFFHGLYLKEYLQPSLFVYYIRDFLLSQQYFVRHGRRAEPLIIQKADAVAANSKYLADYAGNFNKNSVDIGQGCDVEDFLKKPSTVPADISGISYPIIGYCGSLTATRLDIQLVIFIAQKRPDWNIVLVGPQDEVFKNSDLHKMTNVFFLGSKNPSDLPAYTHAFDVCINPQLLNQMTVGNYPRKVDEYLAAGKPVVATKTAAMEMFAECTYLSINPQDYVNKIDQALSEAGDEEAECKRRDLARSHTWTQSVSKLYKLINETIFTHGKK